MRRGLLTALLCLPLLSGLTGQALAQGLNVFTPSATKNIAEGTAENFVVQVTQAPTTDLTVSYTLGGTATAGTDYTIAGGSPNYSAGTGTFTILSGTTAWTNHSVFKLTGIADSIQDIGETIVITIAAGNGYGLGSPISTTFTFIENRGDANFAVSGNPRVGETLTINLTADDPDGNGTVTHHHWEERNPGGEWSIITQTGSAIHSVNNETYVVRAEDLGMELRGKITYTDGVGLTRTVYTSPVGPIVSSDMPKTGPVTATLSFVGGDPLPEGAGGVFNVELSRALGPAETVKLPLVIGGTATRGTDYRIVCIDASPAGSASCNDIDGDSPSITFDGAHVPSNGRTTGPLRLETIEDKTVEWPDEKVTLQLGGGRTREMTITDAPSSVRVSFTRAKYTVAEDDGKLQAIFKLDKAAGRNLVIPLTYVDVTATSGADYTRFASVTIPPTGSLTHSVDIPVIDDDLYEGNETFKVGIDRSGLPAGVRVDSIGGDDGIDHATVTITDNDPLPEPPGLEFDPAHLTWNEADGCGELEYYGPDGNKIAGNTPQERRQNALAANAPLASNQLSSRGASMELPAGAPGPTYRVKLKTKPSETVKINVHDPNDLIWWGNNTDRTLNRVLVGRDRRASNGRSGIGKPTLTFTPSNWDTYQTVKVKVACTDHFPDAVPLKHVVEGEYFGGTRDSAAGRRVNYGNPDQSWTVWVRVHEQTPPVEIEASGAVSDLPPAGQTIKMVEGETRDFDIEIGKRMLPNGSSGSVSVHLYTELNGYVLGATRKTGIPFADGTLQDTMAFTDSSRTQTVRLEAVRPGTTWLEVSAERDFTWGHDTRRHWTQRWPVEVEHAGICGRTKAVRDEIVRMIPGVSNCAGVTDEHLAAISGDAQNNYLNLDSKGLSSLKAGDFDGLTNLKRLRMDRNSLTTLPAGIFDDLKRLWVLDLDFNQLTTLRPGVFDSLTKLRLLYLNDNKLAALPDGVFKNNLELATLWLEDNPGAPFRPTADAGADQTVTAGATVTLSGTATGPWASSDHFWQWRQVDGPNSNTVVQGGVKKDGATASFTAPATPTVLHLRLAAIPKILVVTRPNASGGTATGGGLNRGNERGYAWVTITVGGGQSSPQEDALPAQVEEPACVSAELMAEAQLAASETWRSSDHVERWSRVLAGFGVDNAYSSNPMTIAEAQAQADRGLKRWAPVAPALTCLAAAPEEQPEQAEVQPVTPTTPILSLSAGSAITEGGSAAFTITADPAPTTDLTIAYSVTETGDFLDAPGAGSRTATLAAGTTSVALSVATVDDAADEADGSVSVTLGTGTGYTVATGKGSGAVTITDNDTPVVSITAGPGVTEGTSAAFTITADPVPAAPLDVTLTITQSGDFATSGQTGQRTVTIPVTGSMTVEVTTVDDSTDEPDGSITATIDTGTGYSIGSPAAATVTVTDNDATTPSTGPTISIADATMNENQYNGWFTVTLSEPVAWPVHVYYATRDSSPVSAVAGQDYLAWKRSWQLRARFRPGQTETKIHVVLYNDSHDEDPETFEMVLFDAGVNGPPGVTVSIADGVAVGTITNSDPMPAAFLSRFGRTVAQQALDGIETRLAAERTPGTAATIAGQALALGTSGHATGASPLDDLLARQAPTDTDPFGHHPPEPLSMTAREALLASSFTTTGETASGSLAIWGRAARDSFDGQEGTFSLDGTATTAMLGADYARDRWLIGLALLQSSADGSYADTDVMPRPEGQACPPGEAGQTPCGEAIRAGDGKVEASLTAVLPYASMQVSERLRFWGALGHGTGEVTLTPEVGGTLTADTSWQMAAAGMRAELAALGSGTLHLTSDALWSRTRSDKTHELAASDATTTRLRAGMEASWQIGLASGAMLTPGLEAGVRHDGGDAERGAGIEIGGSLGFRDPASGFSMDLSARKLIAHDDDDFEENGLAASFIFDPRPESARGLSVSLRQDSGEATGGVDALFMPQALERQEGGGTSHTAEAAYGLPAMAGRFTIAPHARLRMDDHARDYTLGWRLTPERGAPDLSLGLEATRREHGSAAPVHGVGVGLTLRW